MYAGRNGLDCGVKIVYLPTYKMTLHIRQSLFTIFSFHISHIVLKLIVCLFNILEFIIIRVKILRVLL